MAKSEKVPNVDSGMNVDGGIIRIQYSNGPQHYYDKDVDGKKTHISEDKMLELYGYADKEPDQPLTLATAEDYLPDTDRVDEDDPTPGSRPGEIGAVDIHVSDDSGDEETVDISKVDNNREAGKSYQDKVQEFLKAEKEKEKQIESINADLEFIIDTAVAFEKNEDEANLEKARAKFHELFSKLAELKGWSKEEAHSAYESYVNLAIFLLGDKPDDPDDEEEARKRVERSAELTELKGRLDAARDKLAKINVRASGRILKTPKLKAELQEALAEWQALVAEVGAKSMSNVLLEDGDMDDATIKSIAADLTKGVSQELLDAQALAAERGPDGGRWKKFKHNYAKKYNEAGRFGKILRISLIAVPLGVGLGTIMGATGAGIMAGMIARSAVRSALTAKMQALKAKGGELPTDLNIDDIDISADDLTAEAKAKLLADKISESLASASAEQTQSNMKSNRRRAGKAIAIGTIVGAASGIVANMAMDQDWFKGGGAYEKLSGGHRPHPIGGGYHHGPNGPGATPPVEAAPTPAPNPGDFSGVRVPILDGKPFQFDVEAANIVPKGHGAGLVQFLHERGLDNGVDIPGFKGLGTWHTVDGTSPLTNRALAAINEYKQLNGL